MDMVTQVQNLDEAVWISHSVNGGKGILSIILPPAIVGQIGLFNDNQSSRRKTLNSNLLNTA